MVGQTEADERGSPSTAAVSSGRLRRWALSPGRVTTHVLLSGGSATLVVTKDAPLHVPYGVCSPVDVSDPSALGGQSWCVVERHRSTGGCRAVQLVDQRDDGRSDGDAQPVEGETQPVDAARRTGCARRRKPRPRILDQGFPPARPVPRGGSHPPAGGMRVTPCARPATARAPRRALRRPAPPRRPAAAPRRRRSFPRRAARRSTRSA